MFSKVFSLFQSKSKSIQLQPNHFTQSMNQPIKTAMQALTEIWQTHSNCAIEQIKIGTELWHCGRIPSITHIENDLALWTTRNPDHQDHYAGNAISPDSTRPYQPTKLKLNTLRELKAADFNSASLLEFTNEFCASNHNVMKKTLRDWCVSQGLKAVVRINRGPDEVVIIYPANDLKIVATKSL